MMIVKAFLIIVLLLLCLCDLVILVDDLGDGDGVAHNHQTAELRLILPHHVMRVLESKALTTMATLILMMLVLGGVNAVGTAIANNELGE